MIAQPYYERLCLVLLQLDVPCLVGISGKPTHFLQGNGGVDWRGVRGDLGEEEEGETAVRRLI